MKIISEQEFREAIDSKLQGVNVKSVTGPGRSGAVASVYASHILGVPWIPYGQDVPDSMMPVLVVDTAEQSGRTLRKAMRRYETDLGFAVFKEPPRVKFWYERVSQ